MNNPAKLLYPFAAFVICLLLHSFLHAQGKAENFSSALIPDSLTRDANVVCRLDEHEVQVFSPGKISTRERHVYTILNNNGEERSEYRTHYNKLTSINWINGYLYNAQGKELRRLKKKDLIDVPRDGEALVSDDRMKAGSFTYNSYPYTVDFEEEDDEAGTFYLSDWWPPRTDKMSVQLSRYILTVPVEYKFRYKMMNTEIKPVVSEKNGKITYVWEVRNLPVIPDEPFAVSAQLYNPFMLVGPTAFEMEGYAGNLSDWPAFGKFFASLQKGRDVLPEELKAEVHNLTDKLHDPYEKIKVLYNYLQKNTHYVLISFGIGGLQPYDAAYVAKNKYGDCKALSNFMVALLKEAGIRGYSVIINGNEEEEEFFPDFPSQQFNHVICAVPQGKDTVWLECTSQSLPAGYLSAFTANRYGLLVNESGGALVHTPAYLLNDNQSIRSIAAILDASGNLQVKSETDYRGESYDELQGMISVYSKEKQLIYLKNAFSLPTYTVNAFDFSEDNSRRIPLIREKLDLSVTGYANVTGKRIFVAPDILRRSRTKLPENKNRMLDIEFKTEYLEKDSVEIQIPDGYEPESQRGDMFMETKYGKYRMHSAVSGNTIHYCRTFEQYRGKFPASEYAAVKSFYDKIYQADHSQIVLVKKNG